MIGKRPLNIYKKRAVGSGSRPVSGNFSPSEQRKQTQTRGSGDYAGLKHRASQVICDLPACPGFCSNAVLVNRSRKSHMPAFATFQKRL